MGNACTTRHWEGDVGWIRKSYLGFDRLVQLNGTHCIPSHVQQQEEEDSFDSSARWVQNLDYDAFARDVNALSKELWKDQRTADIEHLVNKSCPGATWQRSSASPPCG